jgi:hypothetical protein
MYQLLRAILNAPVTVHAQVINGFDHVTGINAPFIIDVVNTPLLHADGALQTTLFPCNNPRFTYRLEAIRHGFCVYHVFGRHTFTPLFLMESFEKAPLFQSS